jgi:hypothetical protein
MDPLTICAVALIVWSIVGGHRKERPPKRPSPIFKWLGRAVIGLLLIPLVFLVWYTVAAIPVSVAIILGAVIIVCGMRSSAGRMRRLMGRSEVLHLEHQEPEPRDYLYSEADRSAPAAPNRHDAQPWSKADSPLQLSRHEPLVSHKVLRRVRAQRFAFGEVCLPAHVVAQIFQGGYLVI